MRSNRAHGNIEFLGNLWIGSGNTLAEMTADGELLRLMDVPLEDDASIGGLAFDGIDLSLTTVNGDTLWIHDPVVSIPYPLYGTAGGTLTVPVNISDSTGLQSVAFGNAATGTVGISYPTSILDASNASVRAGTVLPAGAVIVPNVNDAAGTIIVGVSFTSAPATSLTPFAACHWLRCAPEMPPRPMTAALRVAMC